MDEARIGELNELQFKILKNAIGLTKDGGAIVYSTCSISKCQNEDIVQRALDYFNAAEQNIVVEDYWSELKEELEVLKPFGFVEGGIKGAVRIDPEIGLCGVMFICKIRKLTKEEISSSEIKSL